MPQSGYVASVANYSQNLANDVANVRESGVEKGVRRTHVPWNGTAVFTTDTSALIIFSQTGHIFLEKGSGNWNSSKVITMII